VKASTWELRLVSRLSNELHLSRVKKVPSPEC
jgi:hypothetical protein